MSVCAPVVFKDTFCRISQKAQYAELLKTDVHDFNIALLGKIELDSVKMIFIL